jgi:excisionase family DNA binding protein
MTATTDRPEFLTIDELATYLRVSLRTAYELVYRGDVPAAKVGGVWRIRRAALDRQLDDPKPEPEPAA